MWWLAIILKSTDVGYTSEIPCCPSPNFQMAAFQRTEYSGSSQYFWSLSGLDIFPQVTNQMIFPT